MGNPMNLDIHKRVVGAIAAAGLAGMGLAIALLNGFRSSTSSDLAVSSKLGIWLSLATLLVGVLILLHLERARAIGRRPGHAGATRAADRYLSRERPNSLRPGGRPLGRDQR